MSNPELGPLRHRPPGAHDDDVVRAAERIINNARAFSYAWDDTFGVYFRAQPPEPDKRGPLSLVGRYIGYEWNRRSFGYAPEIELPPNFDDDLDQDVALLVGDELVAYQKGPVVVSPEQAQTFAFVGQQILKKSQWGALEAGPLTPNEVSLIQHMVEVVQTTLSPRQEDS